MSTVQFTAVLRSALQVSVFSLANVNVALQQRSSAGNKRESEQQALFITDLTT